MFFESYNSYSENASFLINPLFYTQEKIRQTKYIVIMTRGASTEIVNFMTPGVLFLVLRRGHTNDILKMHFFLKNPLLYCL